MAHPSQGNGLYAVTVSKIDRFANNASFFIKKSFVVLF